jgi:pyridoxamine 5'-phosphate oxidase
VFLRGSEVEQTPEEQVEEVFTSKDPFEIFAEWMSAAQANEINDPTAFSLATVDQSGMPNSRMVLLKGVSDGGFVFYTNVDSKKGEELKSNNKAAICFHWKTIRRQVRIRGIVEAVSDSEADAYFKTRAKDSQIGAWASRQSHPLESRFELEKEVAKFAAKFALRKVDRPPYWSGFRVRPLEIEFWRNRPFRLHDRLLFRRDNVETSNWTDQRLFP